MGEVTAALPDVNSLPPQAESVICTSSGDQDDDQDLPLLTQTAESTPSLHQYNEGPEVAETGPFPPRSNSESNGDVPEMSEAPRVSPSSGPSVAGAGAGTGSTSRTERRPEGGINWWRSYRFPPITTPHAHGTSSTLNSADATPSSAVTTPLSDSPSDTPPTPSSSVSVAPPSSSTQDRELGAPSPQAENRENIVIPVIVVGLQSVGMDHGREHTPPFGDNGTFGANHNEPEPSGNDMNFDGMPDDGDPGALPNSQRPRTWHSRAAGVLRNLRAGRRASHVPQTNDGPGSRTFLIYVIGGYYPPDHGLITGANALDSFEALWELADLLGQVKPQTVSKEEIDNSGLEVIPRTALEQYEKDGKVASNCMERCLICLDDYEPEDDLRLLKCKHAFHKNCVDQWLETGKNNCPACRSKSVSTGPESPTSLAASPT